jgi:hypothetical protein
MAWLTARGTGPDTLIDDLDTAVAGTCQRIVMTVRQGLGGDRRGFAFPADLESVAVAEDLLERGPYSLRPPYGQPMVVAGRTEGVGMAHDLYRGRGISVVADLVGDLGESDCRRTGQVCRVESEPDSASMLHGDGCLYGGHCRFRAGDLNIDAGHRLRRAMHGSLVADRHCVRAERFRRRLVCDVFGRRGCGVRQNRRGRKAER